ncbi:MAG: hypothetical protein K2X48_10495 [Chitinophagaceae bacterium]|nr:hypothetical protein [Chitinophagaceae bacterium]
MQNVTGLSFTAQANVTYKFKFYIVYTAAATATGSRWSISSSQAASMLHYTSTYSLTVSTITTNQGLTAYDNPTASNATSATTGSNVAIIEGVIRLPVTGTITARFASEVAGSAIIARGGISHVEFEPLQ